VEPVDSQIPRIIEYENAKPPLSGIYVAVLSARSKNNLTKFYLGGKAGRLIEEKSLI